MIFIVYSNSQLFICLKSGSSTTAYYFQEASVPQLDIIYCDTIVAVKHQNSMAIQMVDSVGIPHLNCPLFFESLDRLSDSLDNDSTLCR